MTIVDAHTHISNVKERFAPIYALAERLGYSQLTVMSLQCAGRLTQNAICALCKALNPKTTYAFGGLDYVTGRDFAAQAKSLRAMGFDGMKMLEGKPTTRALLGNALDDQKYDGYYGFLEETAFPVVLHVADPPEFWDKDKVPSWAVEHGWFYGEGDHAPVNQYYDEVENMLRKHPKLRAIFAHFFFLSGEPARAQKFLDDHPLVSIDVTAGIEMYENFSIDPAFWRVFFVKNSHRIIFGTDSSDQALDESGDEVDISGYAAMEIDFLRYDKPITVYDKKLHGLGLPESAQRRIFSENYHALVGKTPRPIDIPAMIAEAVLLRGYLKTDEDRQTMDTIVSQLKEMEG